MKKRALILIALAPVVAPVFAQSIEAGIRQPWSTYIFVSTLMPRESLVSLAREASQARATLVLRGFPAEPANLGAMQRFVAGIDAECCGVGDGSEGDGPRTNIRVAWEIDPRLFDRYHVTAAPTFVLAPTAAEGEFSRVQGDMALANALKFMAQGSGVPQIRDRAAALYAQAFGGRQ